MSSDGTGTGLTPTAKPWRVYWAAPTGPETTRSLPCQLSNSTVMYPHGSRAAGCCAIGSGHADANVCRPAAGRPVLPRQVPGDQRHHSSTMIARTTRGTGRLAGRPPTIRVRAGRSWVTPLVAHDDANNEAYRRQVRRHRLGGRRRCGADGPDPITDVVDPVGGRQHLPVASASRTTRRRTDPPATSSATGSRSPVRSRRTCPFTVMSHGPHRG